MVVSISENDCQHFGKLELLALCKSTFANAVEQLTFDDNLKHYIATILEIRNYEYVGNIVCNHVRKSNLQYLEKPQLAYSILSRSALCQSITFQSIVSSWKAESLAFTTLIIASSSDKYNRLYAANLKQLITIPSIMDCCQFQYSISDHIISSISESMIASSFRNI